jgi:hypothetical protein
MGRQPESRLSYKIQLALRDEYGRDLWCFKVHGGPLTPSGTPDIIGVVHGRLFALETKMPRPDSQPSEIQQYVMSRIRRAGGIVGVPRSIADALDIVARGLLTPPSPRRRTGDLGASTTQPRRSGAGG